MGKFFLEVTPKITKESLYSELGQEAIMEHYLGVPVKKGLFVCPPSIRQDTKPTCAFYKNGRGNLIFKDFAGMSGDAISIVMELFSCSYYQALRIVANDFNLVPYTKREVNPPKMVYTGNVLEETVSAVIQVEIKGYTDKELDWWEGFGISLEVLKKFKVYSIKSVFLNGSYFMSSTDSSPIYGYYGGKNSDKEELWRLYMPTKMKYRFLSNWTTMMLQGARQLPVTGDHLIITKSTKDVMSLYVQGFTAVAPISETVVLTKGRVAKLSDKFKNIICIYDNDLAGVKGAKKYKREHNMRCVFIKRKYAKDISDLFKKLNYVQRLEVKGELKSILEDKTIKKTKYFYIL